MLARAMRDRGVREGLIGRCMAVLRKTKNRVKVGGITGEEFWMGRGVRQGCPLSPSLFNLLIADLEEEMRKGKLEGVRLGRKRVYRLTYADDVVLMWREEDGMRSMIARLERYLEGKGLVLNVGKSKVMRFREEEGWW